MTIYNVGEETFYSLSEAKKEMRSKGLKGFKTKVYSNGDWVPCVEITLNGSNKCYIVGEKNCKSY